MAKTTPTTHQSCEQPNVESLSWQQAREILLPINPQLTTIIDALSPDQSLYLYQVHYQYGDIIDNGDSFRFPDGDQLNCLSQHSNQQLIDDFLYAGNYIPMGITTNKTMELFIDTGNSIIPSQIFSPGDIFALSLHLEKNKSLHPTPITQMAAGTRACFSLPNINDSVHFMQLKRKLQLKSSAPSSLYEQGSFFKHIARAKTNQTHWRASALLFPQQWIELIQNDSAWQALYSHLIETAWLKSSYLRNKIYYDYSFNQVTHQRNLKPNPYLAETFKYLLAIALGEFPGLRIAVDNSSLPLDALQDALLNDYGLKQYIPSIVHAAKFNYQYSPYSIYYSLQYPTVLASLDRSKRLTTTLHDLRELKHIFLTFQDAVLQASTGLHQTVIADMLQSLDFHFLHSKKDIHHEVDLAETAATFDRAFNHCELPSADRKPAFSGSLLRGCIAMNNPNRSSSDKYL